MGYFLVAVVVVVLFHCGAFVVVVVVLHVVNGDISRTTPRRKDLLQIRHTA